MKRLALLPVVLLLSSCGSIDPDMIGDGRATAFVGKRWASGVEVQVANYAIGLAITARHKPATAPVLEEGEAPYLEPLADK